MALINKLLIFLKHPQPIAFIFLNIFGLNLTKNFFSIKRNGYKLSLENNDMSLSQFHKGRNSYRAYEVLFDGLLEKGDNFIDVGGSIGLHSIYAKNIVKHGTVIIIEPMPEMSENAAINFNLNSVSIELISKAVSDNANGVIMPDLEGRSYILDSELRSNIAENSSIIAGKKYNNKANNTILVNSCTLDAVTEKLDQISLIKIDTEGAELLSLKSGIQCLKKTNSVITGIFDPYSTSRFNYAASDIADFLIENGFHHAYKANGSVQLSLTKLDMPNEKFDSPDMYLFSKMDISSSADLKQYISIEEWQRDDIDISFFATPIEKAISFKTLCN